MPAKVETLSALTDTRRTQLFPTSAMYNSVSAVLPAYVHTAKGWLKVDTAKTPSAAPPTPESPDTVEDAHQCAGGEAAV